MRRRKPKPVNRQSEQTVGRGAILCWVIVAAAWGHTVWAIYSASVRRVHVHLYGLTLILDVMFPVLAIVMTLEWWRMRRQR